MISNTPSSIYFFMFIKIGDTTTLSSTESHGTTFILASNENTVQNDATGVGKTAIILFTFSVKIKLSCICKQILL